MVCGTSFFSFVFSSPVLPRLDCLIAKFGQASRRLRDRRRANWHGCRANSHGYGCFSAGGDAGMTQQTGADQPTQRGLMSLCARSAACRRVSRRTSVPTDTNECDGASRCTGDRAAAKEPEKANGLGRANDCWLLVRRGRPPRAGVGRVSSINRASSRAALATAWAPPYRTSRSLRHPRGRRRAARANRNAAPSIFSWG
jgi:hypothetical protein